MVQTKQIAVLDKIYLDNDPEIGQDKYLDYLFNLVAKTVFNFKI